MAEETKQEPQVQQPQNNVQGVDISKPIMLKDGKTKVTIIKRDEYTVDSFNYSTTLGEDVTISGQKKGKFLGDFPVHQYKELAAFSQPLNNMVLVGKERSAADPATGESAITYTHAFIVDSSDTVELKKPITIHEKNGRVSQDEMDGLIGALSEHLKLDISEPQKTSDGKAQVIVRKGSDFIYKSNPWASHSEERNKRYEDFERHYRQEGFDRALIISDDQREERTFIGKSEPTKELDPVTGRPMTKTVYTEAYNFSKGEHKILKPEYQFEIKETGDFMRQQDLDKAVEQMRKAVADKEISQLAPAKEAHPFDALLKNADQVALEGSNAALPFAPRGQVKGVA